MKIAADKWKHFYVGIALGILFHAIALFYFQWPPITSFWIALALVVAVGYGFELFSLVTGLGHYDVMDAVATVLGGLPGIAVCWLF